MRSDSPVALGKHLLRERSRWWRTYWVLFIIIGIGVFVVAVLQLIGDYLLVTIELKGGRDFLSLFPASHIQLVSLRHWLQSLVQHGLNIHLIAASVMFCSYLYFVKFPEDIRIAGSKIEHYRSLVSEYRRAYWVFLAFLVIVPSVFSFAFLQVVLLGDEEQLWIASPYVLVIWCSAAPALAILVELSIWAGLRLSRYLFSLYALIVPVVFSRIYNALISIDHEAGNLQFLGSESGVMRQSGSIGLAIAFMAVSCAGVMVLRWLNSKASPSILARL